MADEDARAREIAELKARLAALEASPIAPAPASRKSKGPGAGLILLSGIAVVLVLASIVGSLSPPVTATNAIADNTSSVANTTTATTSAAASVAPAKEDAWTYSDTTDAMGRTSHLACTTSTNSVIQDAPYASTDVRLCLRRKPGSGLNIFVELNGNGQVLCGIESCSVPVRFDAEEITHFPGTGSADNSSNIIFLDSEARFVQRLRKSKNVAVELTIYQNGVQGVTFDTAGLKWS